MISVILPFYNANQFLTEAIDSVINQSIDNWELLLINDGSTDDSKKTALSYEDRRIRYFEQENQGVSSARNRGLANMKGDFFCFLDADDILPVNSLKSRFNLLKSYPFLKFADGQVTTVNYNLKQICSEWVPNFVGEPLKDLIRLNGKSFLGLTWMVRRDLNRNYEFNENITHSEDLLFLMELARYGGFYDFTKETILYYRNTPNSAMKNLDGLLEGYKYLEKELEKWSEVSSTDLNVFRWKYKKAMTLSYLRGRNFLKALKVWI